MPSFYGCERTAENTTNIECSNDEMMKFINANLRYPAKAKAEGIEGMIIIQFVVDTTGEVIQSKIVTEIGGGCGDVGLAVVNAMPKWEPGLQDGKKIKVLFTLPLNFSLVDEPIDGNHRDTGCSLLILKNAKNKSAEVLLNIFDEEKYLIGIVDNKKYTIINQTENFESFYLGKDNEVVKNLTSMFDSQCRSGQINAVEIKSGPQKDVYFATPIGIDRIRKLIKINDIQDLNLRDLIVR